MNLDRRSLLTALPLLVFTIADAQELSSDLLRTYELHGILKNNDGTAAAGYVVDVVGSSQTSTRRVRTTTDKEGAFSASGLKSGDYVLAPYLEESESRYPGGTSSFYEPNPTRIHLGGANQFAVMNITLGIPNRILSGEVRSLEGVSITATIQIEVQGDPYRFIRFGSSSNGSFRVLVPAETRFTVKINAPGYDEIFQVLGPLGSKDDAHLDIRMKPILK